MKNLKFGTTKLETYESNEMYKKKPLKEKLVEKKKSFIEFLKSDKFKEDTKAGFKKIGEEYTKIANSKFAENVRKNSLVSSSSLQNPNFNRSYFERINRKPQKMKISRYR